MWFAPVLVGLLALCLAGGVARAQETATTAASSTPFASATGGTARQAATIVARSRGADSASEGEIRRIVLVLLGIAGAMGVVTYLYWRTTRPVTPALARLAAMESRRWQAADRSEREAILDGLVPPKVAHAPVAERVALPAGDGEPPVEPAGVGAEPAEVEPDVVGASAGTNREPNGAERNPSGPVLEVGDLEVLPSLAPASVPPALALAEVTGRERGPDDADAAGGADDVEVGEPDPGGGDADAARVEAVAVEAVAREADRSPGSSPSAGASVEGDG